MRISYWSSDVCSSDLLSTLLGQPVIVENKPGANATIAANYVAKAKPDGYTLFVTTNTSHSAAPWLMKNVAYDPIKDFTPIARGGNLPFLLVTNPSRPYKTVQELMKFAKSNPDVVRSEEHTSELQSLMRISYAVF